MSFFKYDEILKIENEDFNNQHLILMRSINGIFKYISHNESEETIKNAFENFISKFFLHMLNEERILTNKDNLLQEKHREDHKKFMDQMTEYLKSFEKDEHVSYSIMLNFINNWFTNHITTFDRYI